MTNALYVARPYDLPGYPLMDGNPKTALIVGETILWTMNNYLKSKNSDHLVIGDFLSFPGKDAAEFSKKELERYYVQESFEDKIETLINRFPTAEGYLRSDEANKAVYSTFSFVLRNSLRPGETYHILDSHMDTINEMFTGVGLVHLGTSFRHN